MAKWTTLFDPKDEVPILGQRVVVFCRSDRPKRRAKVASYDDVFALMEPVVDLDREGLWVMVLDDNDRLIGIFLLHLGGTSNTYVDVGTLMRTLLTCGSPKAIVMHNHPSGGGTPSYEDISITKKMKSAASMFGISVEHVIMSREDNCSSGGGFSSKLWLNPADSVMPSAVEKYELRTSLVDVDTGPCTKIIGPDDAELAVRAIRPYPSKEDAVLLCLDERSRLVFAGSLHDTDHDLLLGLLTMGLVSGTGRVIFSIPVDMVVPPRDKWYEACDLVGLRLLDVLYRTPRT